ncbi:MAG: pseudouridine synthase [Gammaproteobacteria bacterium]|nr:MAG: pseudouridine synthase [Gammaproteobacteria bacterium]
MRRKRPSGHHLKTASQTILSPPEPQRLQKVLARTGLGSRRMIETLISEGRISVNGQPAKLGMRVGMEDSVRVNGQKINLSSLIAESHVDVLMYHKPTGEITSRRDPEGRPTVFQRLPKTLHGRWIAAGRLDINTSGLLLFTTGGALANQLMHPSSEFEREYAVRVLGRLNDAAVERLTIGVKLDDGMARFASIKPAGGRGANCWYHVVTAEGRNRIVRRLFESQDVIVNRLMRIRFGPICLDPKLKKGTCRHLNSKEMRALKQACQLSAIKKDAH